MKRGWGQAELADRLAALGVTRLNRSTIAKIEAGGTRAQNLSLDDALAISAALGVAPVNMMLPTWHRDTVAITPKLKRPAGGARAWFRGLWPLETDEETLRVFFTEIAPEEAEALLAQARARNPDEGIPAPEHYLREFTDKQTKEETS